MRRQRPKQDLLREAGRARPVNVVGHGDYFDPRFAAFLTGLARESGGTFLGR